MNLHSSRREQLAKEFPKGREVYRNDPAQKIGMTFVASIGFAVPG